MVQIGNLTLDAPFFQAGLAGYSDAAMRLIARRHGAPYAVTEAMLDMFLINGGKGLAAAELDDEDHPIAGQLMGSHPREIAQGAQVLVKLGYDVIDVNLACPVKKIRRKARGGHLLQEPDEAGAILDAVRQAVDPKIPCTVKLRRGTDDSAEAEANFHRIFEAVIRTGYAAATVHGRTVEQKYLGPSRWEFLADLTKRYAGCGVRMFGSGDIWNAADIFRMIRQTGVSAVSVARGCIGNPWIFTQARTLMAESAAGIESDTVIPPTIAQQRAVLLEHFDLSMNLHGERSASMMMRKFGIKFSRHHPQGPQVSKAFIAVRNVAEWRAVIDTFYAGDGVGVLSDAAADGDRDGQGQTVDCEMTAGGS
ncbi:MAG: tRNA-dihydrouridine synthase [Phycisphaeraceae bacterium]|nr:tRNA-dihydrouridine synthase [Phycisphaeraceae bacterium]